MTLAQYNACCAGLPHATHVVQWGGAPVWKVAGKVFASAGWSRRDEATSGAASGRAPPPPYRSLMP